MSHFRLSESVRLVPPRLLAHPAFTGKDTSGKTPGSFNVLIHALGNVGVFVLLVPTLERWVGSHVMAGR